MSDHHPASRGLDGVVAVRTHLSHVDGQNGVLIIRGYELKDLAGHVTFEGAAHLLWMGRLPTPPESEELSREIASLRPIPAATLAVVREAEERGASPIDALRMACSTLSLDLDEPDDISPNTDLGNANVIEQHDEDHLIRPQSEYIGPAAGTPR